MNGSRKQMIIIAGALLAGVFTFGPVALGANGERSDNDFGVIMGEMRSALSHTSDLRSLANRGGDRLKETCVYERLRVLSQAVAAAEVAQVSHEGAVARGDQAAAAEEMERGQRALEIVRRMRNESDNCVGRELERTGPGSSRTIVTVETNVPADEPGAGPAEYQPVRPARLDLPGSRPVPASPF